MFSCKIVIQQLIIISIIFAINLAISVDICKQCVCDNKTLNCTSRNINDIQWPSQLITKAIFSKNNLTILKTIPEIDSSLELDLSNCQIKSLDDKVFGNIKTLIILDLSYNYLTSEEISSTKLQGNLQDLNLAYNQIHSLHQNAFKFMPNLKRLNLEGNNFKVLDVQTQHAFSKLSGLLSLNLANNELTVLSPNVLEPLNNLVEINLAKNEFDFVPDSLKIVGKTLKNLTIDENFIFELNENSFLGLTELTEISANNLIELRQIRPYTFIQTPKLSKLSLCNNSVLESISSLAFSPDSRLEELYLNNNNLSEIPFNLIDWSKLRAFQIKDNPLICTCALYNIITALFGIVKEAINTCRIPTTTQSLNIASLKSDICKAKRMKLTYNHFSIPLAGLTVVLMVALMTAIFLLKYRCRKFQLKQRRNSLPTSTIPYSTLANTQF